MTWQYSALAAGRLQFAALPLSSSIWGGRPCCLQNSPSTPYPSVWSLRTPASMTASGSFWRETEPIGYLWRYVKELAHAVVRIGKCEICRASRHAGNASRISMIESCRIRSSLENLSVCSEGLRLMGWKACPHIYVMEDSLLYLKLTGYKCDTYKLPAQQQLDWGLPKQLGTIV